MRQFRMYVNGLTLVIKSRVKSYMGNHCGFYVSIYEEGANGVKCNEIKYHFLTLDRREAEDRAVVRYAKRFFGIRGLDVGTIA